MAFAEVIAQLEKKMAAIDAALAALRGLNGIEAPRRGPGRPPAAKHAAANQAPAKRRRGISAEGRKRLAEAMKRRWAAKRTAAQAKKAGRRKKAAGAGQS
jgi:hypothetical protein